MIEAELELSEATAIGAGVGTTTLATRAVALTTGAV